MANTNTKENRILLQWRAGDEKKDPNTIVWMVILFALTSASLVYNFVLHEWMVGIVFAFMIVILIWYFFGSAKSVDIALTTNGIQLNKQFYDFENIKGYWFSERSGTFYIEPKKRSGMVISFPIGNKKIEEIQKNLPDYLTEIEGRGEDILDRITHLLHM
ncbi:MAG: hypothetical protein PHU42_00270 [Patescibacteria group bacterium]|nr:hypothetical protein [Patescibacteria group bacterium]